MGRNYACPLDPLLPTLLLYRRNCAPLLHFITQRPSFSIELTVSRTLPPPLIPPRVAPSRYGNEDGCVASGDIAGGDVRMGP